MTRSNLRSLPTLPPSPADVALAQTELTAGFAGLLARDRPVGRQPLLALPAFFCLVNIASLHAIANLVTGRRIDRWTPDRAAESVDAEEMGSSR